MKRYLLISLLAPRGDFAMWLYRLMLAPLILLPGLTGGQEMLALDQSDPDSITSTKAHYLVVESDRSGGLKVVHHQLVTMSSPLESLTEDKFTARAATSGTRFNDVATVQVVDSTGRVTFQTVVEVPRWLRSESLVNEQDPTVRVQDSNIKGHHFEQDVATFVVRVPASGSGTQLHIQPRFASALTEVIDLDAVTAQFATSQAQVAPGVVEFVPGWNNGPSSNRVDLLILGDGYTSSQQAQFNTDSQNLANQFAAITPYNEYGNYFNIRRIFTVSPQAGADRPTCSDPDDYGLDNNTFVTTAFDATFCDKNIWRQLKTNDTKVYTAAAASPDWDHILVVVNTNLYGGSGGSYAVSSIDAQAPDIVRHEFGHSFTQLADEYTDPNPDFPACSDIDSDQSNNCEANVTDQTVRDLIKWNRWLNPSTPIPTTAPLGPLAAGLWEGARYLSSGMYRQGYDCLMNNLGQPFCTVEREAFVKRLYNGGWGTPGGGVNNFDKVQPAGSVVYAVPGMAQTFSATALGPRSGSSLTAKWFKNGVLVKQQTVANGMAMSYTYTPTSQSYQDKIQLQVIDNSPFVHSSIRPSLASQRNWTVYGGDR